MHVSLLAAIPARSLSARTQKLCNVVLTAEAEIKLAHDNERDSDDYVSDDTDGGVR